MAKSIVTGLYDNRRKLRFLKNLAVSSHVADSARKAGVAVSTVYFWRQRDPEFHRQWMRSLAAGYDLLEMELLDRARNGVDKAVFHDGRQVATVREYNDGLGVKLLLAHKEMVALIRATEGDASSDEVRVTLDRKLGDVRAKLLRRRALAEGQAKPPAPDHE